MIVFPPKHTILNTGGLIEETVYLGDIPVAVMTSSGSYQVDPDNINAPHIITDQTGNQVWTWSPLDFGTNAPNQNPSGLGVFPYNLRFPGQYYDDETALSYNMARDYNAVLGRYIQSDPIGLAGGQLSTYTYVGNNPLTKIDPFGLADYPPQVYGPLQQPDYWVPGALPAPRRLDALAHKVDVQAILVSSHTTEIQGLFIVEILAIPKKIHRQVINNRNACIIHKVALILALAGGVQTTTIQDRI